jgi:hypothetical protein
MIKTGHKRVWEFEEKLQESKAREQAASVWRFLGNSPNQVKVVKAD